MTERLRVTGGTRRGRKLQSPPKNTIRPASDLVRQALFNMLGDDVVDCVFYDVFAGTGIVGIEALSRGAARAIFIERDRRQLQLIRQNLDRVQFGAEASVRGSDAFVWGRHFYPESDPTIIFLGPPYPLFDVDEDRARMLEIVELLQSRLEPKDLLVLQMPSQTPASILPDNENWYRIRQYGKTRLGIWRLPQPEEEDDESSASEATTEPMDDLGI